LEALGHDVSVISFWDYLRWNPSLEFKIVSRTLWSLATVRFNRVIIESALSHRFDWIWVDRGIHLFPETTRVLRETGNFLVHHLTDDFLNPRHWMFYRYFKKSIPDYCAHLTSNCFNVRELKDYGAAEAIQTYLGFDHDFCRPEGGAPRTRQEFASDVVFVGFWRDHIDNHILPLINKGIAVKTWGTRWRKSPNRRLLEGSAAFRPATNEEYPHILASAKIALCFLAHENRNTSTGRSFEIPAVGTFMLGERTDEHAEFFKEGKEAEFFDSPEELVDKTLYYLAHDEDRNRIARAGHERAMTSGYSYYDRIRVDVQNVTPIYEAFRKTRANQ
jgi:spore maturation protein CgeB